jgi:hypothetical protein
MQAVEILVDIVKELIRLTNEGQITWEASKTTPDSGYMVLAQDVYTTTVNDNRYILKYGTNGCTLSMNGKMVLWSHLKDNPPNYIDYLQSLSANPLYQLHNAIISEPTVEIDFIANVLDGLKSVKSNNTKLSDIAVAVDNELPKETVVYKCDVQIDLFKRIGWDDDEESKLVTISAESESELTSKLNKFVKDNTYRQTGDFGIVLGSSECKVVRRYKSIETSL